MDRQASALFTWSRSRSCVLWLWPSQSSRRNSSRRHGAEVDATARKPTARRGNRRHGAEVNDAIMGRLNDAINRFVSNRRLSLTLTFGYLTLLNLGYLTVGYPHGG